MAGRQQAHKLTVDKDQNNAAKWTTFKHSADTQCKSVSSPNRTMPTLRLATHLHFFDPHLI